MELRPSTRLTLDGVFEYELFKSARKLSAERNAMVVHYKEQARVERERAAQFEYSTKQAQAASASLEKELTGLRDEHAKARC